MYIRVHSMFLQAQLNYLACQHSNVLSQSVVPAKKGVKRPIAKKGPKKRAIKSEIVETPPAADQLIVPCSILYSARPCAAVLGAMRRRRRGLGMHTLLGMYNTYIGNILNFYIRSSYQLTSSMFVLQSRGLSRYYLSSSCTSFHFTEFVFSASRTLPN